VAKPRKKLAPESGLFQLKEIIRETGSINHWKDVEHILLG